jgi:hypothetical protein
MDPRPPGRDWYMAMGKVEGMLAELGPDAPRDCWFACVLAIAWPDGEHAVYEGRADGTLTWPPRGAMGFGYDPARSRGKASHQPPGRCVRQAGGGADRELKPSPLQRRGLGAWFVRRPPLNFG